MLRLFRGEVAPMSEDLEEQREPGRRIDAEPSPVGLTDYPFSRAGVGATPTAVPSTTAGAPAIAPSDTGLYEDEPGWSVAPTKRARQLDQFLRGQDPFADLQLEQRFEQTRRGQGMADPEGARSPGEEPGLTPGYRRFGTGMTGTGPGVVAPIGTQFGDPRRVPVRPGSERGLTASQIDILLAGGDPMGLSRAEPERAAAQLTAGVGTAGVGTAGVGVTGMGGVQAIRDPNTNFIVAIVIPGKPTIMQDDEGNPVEVPGKPTVINLPTPVSRLEEALRQAQITGFIDGKPTFAREQAISIAERANLSTRANIALNAAQEARARGDQKEAIRQFDKAQDLRDAIQRGQLDVSVRAQTEAELEGRLRRDLQERQFQFQAARDPASAFVKAQRASAIATPGGTPPLQKDDDPGETPAENFKWQEGALNVSKTFVKNPLVSKRVQDIFRGSEGEFRVPSQQATQNLLASERAQLASGLKYMGFDPADVAEQTRKLTATTTPAQAMTTLTDEELERLRAELAGLERDEFPVPRGPRPPDRFGQAPSDLWPMFDKNASIFQSPVYDPFIAAGRALGKDILPTPVLDVVGKGVSAALEKIPEGWQAAAGVGRATVGITAEGALRSIPGGAGTFFEKYGPRPERGPRPGEDIRAEARLAIAEKLKQQVAENPEGFKNPLDWVGGYFRAAQMYQEERPEAFPGEKAIEEFIYDPLNIVDIIATAGVKVPLRITAGIRKLVRGGPDSLRRIAEEAISRLRFGPGFEGPLSQAETVERSRLRAKMDIEDLTPAETRSLERLDERVVYWREPITGRVRKVIKGPLSPNEIVERASLRAKMDIGDLTPAETKRFEELDARFQSEQAAPGEQPAEAPLLREGVEVEQALTGDELRAAATARIPVPPGPEGAAQVRERLKELGFAKHLRTSGRSSAALQQQLTEHPLTYEGPRSTRALSEEARDLVETNPMEAVSVINDAKKITDREVALAQHLAARYEDFTVQQQELVASAIEKTATGLLESARTLQAASIFERLSPEGILVYANRVVIRASEKHGGEKVARQVRLVAQEVKKREIRENSKRQQDAINRARERSVEQEKDIRTAIAVGKPIRVSDLGNAIRRLIEGEEGAGRLARSDAL